MGFQYRLDFSADGTLALAAESPTAVQGRWMVRDNRCCVDIDGFKDCFTVVDHQDARQFYDASGTLLTSAAKLAP